jgi:aminoglycoside phosphotransferase (APT) family kinase protein
LAISEGELQRRLSEYFEAHSQGRKHARASNIAKISDGWETDVYAFTLKYQSNGKPHSEDLILRLYPGENVKEKATKEFRVMAKLHEIGFPVPKVYYLETDQSIFGKPFVIMEKVDGLSMGEKLGKASEKARNDMLSLFCRMLVDLHRLDIKPFVSDSAIVADPFAYDANDPYGYLTRLFAGFRRYIIHFEADQAALGVFNQVMDWLEERAESVPSKKLSPVHLDYHFYNVLIREDGGPFVIDWTNFDVTDYRVDLAWTLLLTSTYGRYSMRNSVLEMYERTEGNKVENIEYFEVVAATRRLGSIYLSLGEGAEKLGMRPEAASIMRQQATHIKAVVKVLSERTGIRISIFDELLKP